MKKLICLIITLLATTAIKANEKHIIDVFSLQEVSKAVSTAPKFTISESGDSIHVSMSFRYFSLSSLYKNKNSNFYHLLPIGNHLQMPGMINHFSYPEHSKDFDYYSDFEYACLDYNGDNDDMIPDVYYGRIPATTPEESTIAVDKIISYEKDPVMNEDFYNGSGGIFDYSGDYIDFATGQRCDDPAHRPLWRSGYEIRQTDDNEITIVSNYALVATWEMQPSTEYWDIPGSFYNKDFDACPLIPIIKYTVNKHELDELNSFHIESLDYVDFHEVNCMAGWAVWDPTSESSRNDVYDSSLTRSIHIEGIRPYSGFFPSDRDLLHVIDTTDNYDLFITPLQYDMENQVMRVNRKIIIRRGSEESSVSDFNMDDEQCTYYSLDGRIEPNPIKGNIYIKKSGDNFSKIIF